MRLRHFAHTTLAIGLSLALSGCGGIGSGDSGIFKRKPRTSDGSEALQEPGDKPASLVANQDVADDNRETIWGLFKNADDPNTTVEVNKYIWQASLEVLNFLPIESVDPFTGVIVTGYGRPPGGGRAYRATIYVQDPALDARSLKVALQSRGGGAVPVETQRAVEDAILTRARQLRIRDSKL